MALVVVEYQTKPDRSEENQQLIEQVFAELRDTTPADLRYAVVRLGDRFLHIVDAPEGSTALSELTAFGAFQAAIAERFAVPAHAKAATLIGRYPDAFPIGPTADPARNTTGPFTHLEGSNETPTD